VTRVINVAQVAEMLGCSEETVRDHTPHELPGVKFGRDWVFVEADVIAAVSRLAQQIHHRAAPGAVPDLPKPRRLHGRAKPLPELPGQV
jgi:predicted DNA-binding transcriptional regulator AlpA